jgi:hypothetical protein
MRPFVAPHDVAGMEVAMQAQCGQCAGVGEGAFDQVQRGSAAFAPQRALGVRQVRPREDARPRVGGPRRAQRAPLRERLVRTHRMQAAEETAEPLQRLGVLELGPAAGMAVTDRDAVRAYMRQRRRRAMQCDGIAGRVQFARRDHRHVLRRQLARERVLFEDLRVAPASWPIELGDDHLAVLEMNLEDAVLVRVELQQAAVAAQADGIECVEHARRLEFGVAQRRSHRRIVAAQLCVPVPG